MRIMLTVRSAKQIRGFLFSPSAINAIFPLLFSTTSSSIQPYAVALAESDSSRSSQSDMHRSEVVEYFREWFMSRRNPLFDRIFEILRTQDDSSLDSALSRLNLYVTERLVIDVLKYEQKDVLASLKFFDWAGRQQGFYHTKATFHTIFRILSKQKLMSVMLDFLQNFTVQRYACNVGYHSILVTGYAVAGKCEVALQIFGRMRFGGMDLDLLSYHVLMNALIEHEYFDAVEMVANQIAVRGFQNEITHSIMMKSFCKQNELEKGAEYLQSLAQDDSAPLSGIAVGTFVDSLCKHNQFKRAALVIEQFRGKALASMEHPYGVWIRNLIDAGDPDGALEFLKDKQAIERYVPDVFRYNMFICRLLRENRIQDVHDLLVDMKERDVMPDNVTMNSVLCLLCKSGRPEIALDLYDLRADLGLSVNYMAYNYLINTLTGDGSAEEAYRVLRTSIEHDYFPRKRTFSIIADALCRERKFDKMQELIHFMLDQNIIPKNLAFDKFISALCKAKKVEEGYLLHGMLNMLNRKAQRSTYTQLIRGLRHASKEDIAVRLLIEMEEKGYKSGKKLLAEVVCCLCKTDNPEDQFFRLLEILLSRRQSSRSTIYEGFIHGAGLAGKPELARQVYVMMINSDNEPSLKHGICLLESYLMSGKLDHAMLLFKSMAERSCSRRLWRSIIVGLCNVKQPELASGILDSLRSKKLRPSLECYEEVIKAHCELGQYRKAIELVNDVTQMGRPVPSFVGNIFLLHALKSKKVFKVWDRLRHEIKLTPACLMLGDVVGMFSGAVERGYDDKELEQLIQKCFHRDTFTNNMLLRRVCLKGMDLACEFFNETRKNGYKPNRWTYDIIVHGLVKDGQTEEARKWMEEMLHLGYYPTDLTERIINIYGKSNVLHRMS